MESNILNKKISIALCTYNGANYISKQLNSILSQTFVPDEIIIVDDCSIDETRDILKSYAEKNSKIKLFFNESNLGSNLSFRKAISLASQEFIALCDQDDIWFDSKLELQMKKINEYGAHSKRPLVSFHDLKLMNDDEEIIDNSFWKLHNFDPNNFKFKDLFLYNIVTGCTCIINREMKNELLRSDMENIVMHDYLIALIGYGFGDVIYHENPLMLYRSNSSSVTIKEKISLKHRIESFINRVSSKEYLKPNINQIEEFLDIYGSKLTLDKLNLSKEFVSLKNKSLFKKIQYKWLIN